MFVPPPMPDAAEAVERLRWSGEIAKQVQSPDRIWRVARRIDHASQIGAKQYYPVQGATSLRHHLRPCLGAQITGDLGDHLDGKPQPWSDIVQWAMSLSDACCTLGIEHILSLSGGKGLHLEIFLPPDESRCADDGKEDRRWPIWRRIVGEAQRILWGDNEEMRRIPFDKIFVSPRENSYLLTEHGEKKHPLGPRKMVWFQGVGPAPRLPLDKAEAYRIAEGGPIRPGAIQQSAAAAVLDLTWARELFGRPCPQGPTCFDYTNGWACKECPAI